jgi:hypothetical protein
MSDVVLGIIAGKKWVCHHALRHTWLKKWVCHDIRDIAYMVVAPMSTRRSHCPFMPRGCGNSNPRFPEEHYLHKLFMHKDWLGDGGRHLSAVCVHNLKQIKSAVMQHQ